MNSLKNLSQKTFNEYYNFVLKNKINVIPKDKYKFNYVYRITNLKNNKHYYGVRSSNINPCRDILNYKSSSKLVKKDINNLGINNFKFKIVKNFKKRIDANIFESYLHHKFDCKSSKNFYNLNNSYTTFDTTNCVYVFNNENKIVKITSDEYFKNKDKYTHPQTNHINVLNIATNEKIKIKVGEFNKEKHLIFHHNKVVVKQRGNNVNEWFKIDSDEYFKNKNKYITRNEGKVCVKDKNGNIYLERVDVYKNDNTLKTITSLQTQMRKGDILINIPISEKQKYVEMGFQHMNKNRGNCYNIITGDTYKEDSEKIRKYSYLTSNKNNNLYYFNNIWFKRNSLNNYLKKNLDISFYRYSKKNKLILKKAKDLNNVSENKFYKEEK